MSYDFKREWEEKKAALEAGMRASLPREDESPGRLHQAMRYSLFAGGKRLRGVLVAATAEAVGFHDEARFTVGGALEMVHAYSLVHDDLPAMDNDDFRRGAPTCHKAFGEDMAILAGDGLLTYAFQVLAQHPRGEHFAAVRCRLVEELALAAGTPTGMVAGQALDIQSSATGGDFAALRQIHRQKTGALIRGAVRIGALLAQAGPVILDGLTRYAEHLGVAFQITDDILDATATREALGKTPGKDAAQGKLTYPALFPLAECEEMAAEHIRQALAALAGLDGHADTRFLADTAQKMAARRN